MLFVACAHAAVPEGLTWLDDARPPDDRPVLAVSAATWDPLSRAILERALAGSGDRIAVVAVSEQGPEAWHDLLAATGWQGLSVGLDPGHELVRSWVGGPELGELVLVQQGREVWRRRVRTADDPALNDLLAAGMPVERSGTRIEDLAAPVEEGSLRELRRMVVLIPPEPDVDWMDVVNAAAWRLVTDERARKRDVALGLELATRLVEGVGRDDPGVIDTWARAAWASGLREEALAAEERAVPLAEGMPYEQELIEVRDAWRAELGVVIAPDPWSGSVNAAWEGRTWSALVVPPSEDWAVEGGKLSEMLEIAVATPEAADRSGAMVLYGTPEENPLVAELLAHHRIAFRDDGLAIGTTALKVDAPALIAALPSPWAPGEVVVVYTARDPEAAHQLNAVFHGPAQITVATRADGKRDVVGQLWPVLDDEGRVERVDAAPGTLTAAELEEDLVTLDQLLRDHYSGWADADLRQRADGGWAARTETTLGRIRERASWTYTDAAKLLVFDYLEPIRDTHFTVTGLAVEEGVPTRVDARLVVPVVPYVTDLRLVEREGGVEVATGPDALLGQAVDLPIVPDPRAVVPDTPYRLPTVLADGTEAWLVGVFVEGRSAPESLALLGTELALHRPGSRRTERAKGGWDLSEDGPLPVLAVHTMDEARLEGLAATASELRTRDTLVLDLRANGGGSDRPAADWVGAFSPGRYQAAGGSDVDQGRWQAEAPFAYRSEGAPWTGERLWVLVDRGVASSGETFTFLASQVPNARVVGESTSGCSENGNVTERGPLPHTGLVLHFGRTRFAWEDVRPIAEGVGIFPDLWLDEPDPVSFLAQLP